MRTHAPVGLSAGPASWQRGLVWALVMGATIWGLYFFQASVFDGLFWDVSVVPAVGLMLAGSAILAVVRPHLRSFSLGLACGALVTFPGGLLLAYALIYGVWNLE